MVPPQLKSKCVEKGCYAQGPLARSYLLLWEELFHKRYEAITTWGSVFLNPVLKPSHVQ